jgi:fibronectin type 3 domain-containing protein
MTVSFYSAIAEQTEGFVYDVNGRLVATLFSTTSTVGENKLTIDKPSNITSGLYLLQLKVGNTTRTSKIVVQ